MIDRVGIVPRGTATYDCDRSQLADELYRRYVMETRTPARIMRLARYWRKRYLWLAVVHGSKIAKRTIDVTVAIGLLVLCAPLLVAVALAITLTDKGPVLYWQNRVGFRGREFRFPKFRSMVVNADKRIDQLLASNDHANSITFKMKDDPRVTWIGRVIRRSSIDELPQLWCVLKGEMSLVGPRPPLPSEVSRYSLAQRRRLDVVPGLTCIWQVRGRGDIPFDQQVELDVQYIESQSLWLDVKLLLLTVPAVLFGKGAY